MRTYGLSKIGLFIGGAFIALSLPAFCAVAAQEVPQEAPEASFTTDQAARCAAVYAFTLDAMETAQNVPTSIRLKMRDGLAVWEYELSASTPEATQQTLQEAANRAVAYVRADMPYGEGAEGARARGDFLTDEAKTCYDKIAVAYGGKVHPVIPFLRQAEVSVGDPLLPISQPISKPAAQTVATSAEGDADDQATEQKPKGRGLR